MKLCIPVIECDGPGSRVSDHFGRAPYHLVVEVETGSHEMVSKSSDCSDQTHGHCMPVDLLLRHAVDAVACKGMGRGALHRLASAGIVVFAASAGTAEEIVEEYLGGRLVPLGTDQLCDGHHH